MLHIIQMHYLQIVQYFVSQYIEVEKLLTFGYIHTRSAACSNLQFFKLGVISHLTN